MKIEPADIKQRLIRGLEEYLLNDSELALTQAYELARRSLKSGLGELEIIGLYHKALFEVQQNGIDLDSQDKFERASSYLSEWLAPFEVRLRSYRDLIDELNENNELLQEEIKTRVQAERDLQKSKDHFQSLIENAQDVITVLDHKGVIQYSSPSVKRMLNYSQNELTGEVAFQYIHPDDVEYIEKKFDEIISVPGQVVSEEFRFLHKNGSWVYLESIAKNVQDNPGGPIVVVNSRNITERKIAMQKLKEKRTQLADAQKIAKVGSWEWNPNGDPELKWSEEMHRIYGIEPEHFDHSYKMFIKHIHPDDRERVEKIIQQSVQDKTSFKFENKIIRADGEERVLLCRGEVLTDEEGNITKLFGTGLDITERKEKEEKLRRYSEQLRNLSARIQDAREEERIRISRELHDELGQMLTVLKMDISMVVDNMEHDVIPGSVREAVKGELQMILERINVIIKSVQRITSELRPEVLDDLGLEEAIDWQAGEFEKRTGLEINFEAVQIDSGRINDEQATTLFRVFQETLTNVFRHAEASRVDIKLKMDEDNLLLIVQDNGVGIKETERDAPSSLGIISIRERTELLGGIVQIHGKQGKGTTVEAKIPVKHTEK